MFNPRLPHAVSSSFASLCLLFGLIVTSVHAESDFDARFEEIKKSATDEQLYRFLYDLPKGGDLHSHQDGGRLARVVVPSGYRSSKNARRYILHAHEDP